VRFVTLVGNRPQFVKAAAVSRRLRERHGELLVHSGQHYDDGLSAVFFRELDLPPPDRQLGVGSGPAADQISRIVHAFEQVLPEAAPDVVIVYGDTNTTLAGALACGHLGLPLAHVEAGMRSGDWTMPEERNRVLTDHLSDLCLCSTTNAMGNLAAESAQGVAELVGDVMADVSLAMAPIAERSSSALARLRVEPHRYLLLTVHRAGNVDRAESLSRLVELLRRLPLPTVFPVHPRTRAALDRASALDELATLEHLRLVPPLGYVDFLKLLLNAVAVLTDSGGVQKEAYLARVPCLTLRDTTEWTETVALGWNRLVGLDPEIVLEALAHIDPPDSHPELYGGGRAGRAIVTALEQFVAGQAAPERSRAGRRDRAL
jgi:UDP-N-acetylglucosamine 2-epimerase (non-hydrolysing)/UDP-GlcNAc3NAcA epimerase